MKIYTQVCIIPHHSGFGMFQIGEVQISQENSWAYFDDLIQSIRQNTFSCEKLEDALQDEEFKKLGIEDINGRIYNQPSNIYAIIDDYKHLQYIGIVTSNVNDNFFD